MPPKKKKFNNTRNKVKLDIVYANNDIGQEYGYVSKLFGNCNFKVTNIQGDERYATLTGIIKKKSRVRENDLVLMEPMGEADDCKYIIIFRYTQDQKKILEKEGRLKKVEIEKKEVKEEELFVFENEIDKNKNQVQDLDEWFIDLI